MRTLKILTHIILIIAILISQVFGSLLNITYAVPTDGTASNWTREKAEHLARRVLFYPTPQKVDELYTAGSATSAVNILFPDQNGPDRTQYTADMAYFTGTGYATQFGTGMKWNSDWNDMYRYYLYRQYRDPYEAKAKLFTLFEDTFSVNVQEGIRFNDAIFLHDLLYKNALGNYKTLVKQVLLNNDIERGDYAASQFLNLLRQWDKNNPNQNYARELLQLFLMGEYKPGESKANNDTRNYSEDDVVALSKIITGFWSDSVFPYTEPSGSVYYTGAYHNTSSGVTFLPGNTGWVSFPFYDDVNDVLNLNPMSSSILGNNGLADNTVDYIFAKKSHEIALFLSNKMFRFYVHENPTRGELDTLAASLEANNFEILPTLKTLLASDVMYSDASMNAILYYNPLELVTGLFKTIHAKDPDTLDTSFYAYTDLLTRLGWQPYYPGTIFGRDGFDMNSKWINANVVNQWSNLTTTLMYDYTRTGAYLMTNIIPQSQSGVSLTTDQFITQVQDNLLLGRQLPLSAQNQIKTYLTTSETGAVISFQPNNVNYTKVKYPWVFAFVLSQPEFILKSGYDQPVASTVSEKSKVESATGKLIIIELPGGYDWSNEIIQKDAYADYVKYRTDGSGETIAHPLSKLVDIGNHYMDMSIAYSWGTLTGGASFKSLLDGGYLKIFNRVGTENHSQDHNQAQVHMASYDNTTDGQWLVGELTRYDSHAINTLVMGSRRPFIFQGGNYVNIGYGDNRIMNTNPYGRLNTNQRNQQVNLRTLSMTGRTYPGDVGKIYEDALRIHNVSNLSVSQWGASGVGYSTATQLSFLKTLLNNDTGRIFYLQNTGNGYDTHVNQLSGSTNLSNGIGKVASDVTHFFNQVKDTQNITIVIYSEFGRTTNMNGTYGTDHGQGGGMFVLTSNPDLRNTFSGSVYGNIRLGMERTPWATPGIDYRSVYGKILSTLYASPADAFFKKYSGKLEDNLSETPSKYSLLHNQYRAVSDGSLAIATKFTVEDKNFQNNRWAYIISAFGTGLQNLQYHTNSYDGNVTLKKGTNWTGIGGYNSPDNKYSFDPNSWPSYRTFTEKTPYVYTLKTVNNQYATTDFTGSITLPEVFASSVNVLSSTTDSVLRKYANTKITSTGVTIAGSGIILANTASGKTTFAGRGGVKMQADTGATYITELHTTSTGTIVWNGGFVIGEDMDPSTFLPTNAKVTDMGLGLENFQVEKVIRVGSDTLGVGMNLSRPVTLTLTGVTPSKGYLLLTSEDGINWSRHSTPAVTTDGSGMVSFTTDHFSLFALAVEPPTPICNFSIDPTTLANGAPANITWSTLSASGVMIDRGVGVMSQSGTSTIIPPASATTEYTLTATNPYGSVSCKASVTTKPLPTCAITASETNVKNGRATNLSWTGSNALSGVLAPIGTSVPLIGDISIIPPVSTTTNYILNVSNDVGIGSCSVPVTTYPNSAPTANDDIVGTIQNVEAFFPVILNDTDTDSGDTISLKDIVWAPAHGTATVAGDQIDFVPTNGYCGLDSFTYRIQDQDAATSNTATVQVNVSCGTNPPIVSPMSFSGVEDTVLVGSLSGSDADGDIIQYLLATGATHGTVTLSQTGVFTYTPSQNFNGVDTFAYKATDGTLSGNTEIVTLDVSSVNDVPVAIADTGSTNKNIATSIDILANDIDVDHPVESLIPTIVTQPTNGSLVHSGTIYIYTPNTNYCGGADTFSYFVTDGSGGVSMTVSDSIDVVCVNDPPVAVDDSLSVQEDGSGVVLMLQNDTDPNIGSGDILRLESIVTTPLHGTASLIHTGTPSQIGVTDEAIFYTPEANYCGTDALSYRIADATGSISNTAMVHITIDCVNDIPVTQSIALNGLMDTTLTGQISVTDIDSSMFTYNLTTTPVSGSASIDASGVVTYIPNLGFTGTETLPFTVTDNSGGVSLPRFIQVALSAPSRVVAYSGTVQTSTGEVRLFTGTTQALSVGYTLDLSGKTITALSSSGLTGSIVLPWSAKLTVDGGVWSGEILAPSKIPSNQAEHITLADSGVTQALPVSTPTMTYTYTSVDTIKVGSTGASLALSGWYATVEHMITAPGIVFWSTLRILRSQDGQSWTSNFPDATCTVDNENKCTFQTNHLTYFGTIQVVSTPIASPLVSGGGGGGFYTATPSVVTPAVPPSKTGQQAQDTTPKWLLLPVVFEASQRGKWVNVKTILQNSTSSVSVGAFANRQIQFAKKYVSVYSDNFIADIINWSLIRNYPVYSERAPVKTEILTALYAQGMDYKNIANRLKKLWKPKKK
jgi:uncharacterized protein (DUF1800 family)